jgi:pyruvate dehydrogenase E2 component (dihydrolipoamide acetyltransferase)
MPKLGVEMETGVVVEWFVAVGDPVNEGDVVAEIESEKTTAEVEAREDGVLRRRFLDVGEEAPPGTPMGIVAVEDADVSALVADIEGDADGPTPVDEQSAPAEAGAEEGAPAHAASPEESRLDSATADTNPPRAATSEREGADQSPQGADAESAGPAARDVAPRTPRGRIKATPRARKLADSEGVALSGVSGTGPDGCIVAADVAAAATGDRPERTVSEEREQSAMRATIADRLGRSHREAPHVTVTREVDVEAALAAVDRADEGAAVDVSVVDVVLAAVSLTLRDHPAFNATFQADDAVHTLYREHNLGIAVDVEDGLLTPVLADVRSLSPRTIAERRRRLVERVRSGEYAAETRSGGTFTVSNLGVLGTDTFTPIVNPPQVAILGLGRVRDRAVPADGGIDCRRHAAFSLSFDHRVVDGADAARFLTTLDGHLQDAASLVERDQL